MDSPKINKDLWNTHCMPSSESCQHSKKTHKDCEPRTRPTPSLTAESLKGPRGFHVAAGTRPQDQPHVRQNPVDWEDTNLRELPQRSELETLGGGEFLEREVA